MCSDAVNSGEVVIIGAGGGMGLDLERNLTALGVSVVGMDKVGGPGVQREDVFALSPEAIECISDAGLVILALPDALAIKAAPALLGHLNVKATLMDCTSIKGGYVAAVADASLHTKISINPLFGPGLRWSGGAMAVTPITDAKNGQRWLDLFRRLGLELITLDAETHDRLAAEAQSAAHAACIGFFLSVEEESARFATPPNRLLRLMSARMLSAEAHVYWSIQTKNPFAGVARRRLREGLDLLEHLVDTDDMEGFQTLWDEQAARLGTKLDARAEHCRQLFEFMMQVEAENE